MLSHCGKMNKLIMLQSSTTTKAAGGKRTITWVNECEVWCEFMSTTGREFMAAQQVNDKLTHMLRIRYLSTVTGKWRAKYGDEVFNFDSVANTGQADIELIVMAIQEAA